jgi:Helix-turn-helix domain
MATRAILATIPDRPDPGRPGYFPFPNQLGQDCGKIGSAAIMVYVAMAIHAGRDGRCWPSVPRIVGITRLSRMTVKRALKRLSDMGWIRREFHPGKSTIYHLKSGITRSPTTTVRVVSPQYPEQEPIKDANGAPIRRALR